MSVIRYKLWQFPDPDKIETTDGVTGAVRVGVSGFAKTFCKDAPFAVTNELLGAELGRAIRLPVPPGIVVDHEGSPYFVSVDFNVAGQKLPPADAEALVDRHPSLSCGIIAFDAWIVNVDRHAKNIAFDKASNQVNVFDHSHAFLGARDGKQFLEYHARKIGLGEKHCVAKQIRDLSDLDMWIKRIKQVPEYFIEDVVGAACAVADGRADKNFCFDYLLQRRERLSELVELNRGSLPKLNGMLK